jgi:hypothetical protein
MATLASNVLTLNDWAKRRDPDGKTAMIVEALSESNMVLEDMMFKEGNLPTGERVTIRTGLPDVYYRMMNEGIPKSKSTTAQITENAAELTALSEIDKSTADLEGNVNEFRLSESMAFLEAMSQKQAETLFYGSAANPEEYVGLANRYGDLSAANGQNILDAGGTGSDNASVWLVSWGSQTIHGIFPKGSTAGIQHTDHGEDWAFDASNNRFRAYIDNYEWKNGLVVKDWRYAVRAANVDVSDLVALTGTQALTASTSIIKLMSRSIDRLPTQTGSMAFYVNRTVASHLRIIALEKSNAAISIEPALNQFGENIMVTKFLGIPVRIVDQLTENEARVV